MKYFNWLGSMITKDTRYTREIKFRIAIAKAAFSRKKTFHQQTGLKFEEETNEVLHLEHSFIWYWRRMEKISWINHVRNEEILCRVKEERNIIHTVKRRMAE